MKNSARAFRKAAGILATLTLSLAFAMSTAGLAWANSDPAKILEQAGNLLGASEADSDAVSNRAADRDFYWAGANLDFDKLATGGDIMIAGMNLDLTNSHAGGSVRMAGMNLTLQDVVAENNITVAGQNLDLTNCNAKGAVYCAGQKIAYSGTTEAASFAGETVTINGTIKGDVAIDAENVELGPKANIGGAIRIESENKANVSSEAKVGDIQYSQPDNTAAEAAGAAAGAGVFLLALSKAVGFLGTIVFALLLVWLLRRPVEGATEMTRVRAGRIFATGAIVAIAAPPVIILLLVLTVTAPVAIALTLALIALTFASVPFAAAALSRLALPKMNRFGAAAIGGLVLGIVGIIPIIGFVLTVAAFMYLTGYLVQAGWQARGAKPQLPAAGDSATGMPIPPAPTTPVAPAPEAPAIAPEPPHNQA